jgi:hypothetical protein
MNHFAIRPSAVYNLHLFLMKKSTGKTVDLFPDYKQLLQNVCALQRKIPHLLQKIEYLLSFFLQHPHLPLPHFGRCIFGLGASLSKLQCK